MSKEVQELLMQGVVHITEPHDYYGMKIAKEPIFGFENAEKLGFVPLRADGLEKPVIYMHKKVLESGSGKMMIDCISRDQWEYFRYAQLEMANKFEDTLAYREEQGITTDRVILLGLQYFMLSMLRYSNFNFIIDFNELNRISLKPLPDALKDLFILNAAATQNINWAVIKKTNLNKLCPTLGKKLLLESLNLRNPPEYTPHDGDLFLRRYFYFRDDVLSNQSCQPWGYEPFQTEITPKQINAEFDSIKAQCNPPALQK